MVKSRPKGIEKPSKRLHFESMSRSGWYSFNFRAIRELVQAMSSGETM